MVLLVGADLAGVAMPKYMIILITVMDDLNNRIVGFRLGDMLDRDVVGEVDREALGWDLVDETDVDGG